MVRGIPSDSLTCLWLYLVNMGVGAALQDHAFNEAVYENIKGIQALINNKLEKPVEEDEKIVVSSTVPYTIVRTGKLENTPGGKQGFNFSPGAAAKRSISKEDAARIYVGSLSLVPPTGLTFEVSNGDGCLRLGGTVD